ncbi:hypothetical protein FKM82_002889 [Ascaphus truei]
MVTVARCTGRHGNHVRHWSVPGTHEEAVWSSAASSIWLRTLVPLLICSEFSTLSTCQRDYTGPASSAFGAGLCGTPFVFVIVSCILFYILLRINRVFPLHSCVCMRDIRIT